MAQLPAMPMFWGDYWSKTRRLSPAQHHAYLFLLGATWMNNCRPFIDDDAVLAGEIGIPLSAWLRVRPAVQRFFDTSDGTWRNSRLEETWQAVMKKTTANKINGPLGGRPNILRSNPKDKENQHPEKPNGLAKTQNPETQPEPNQSQSQRVSDSLSRESSNSAPIVALVDPPAPKVIAEEMFSVWKKVCGHFSNPIKLERDRVGKLHSRYRDSFGQSMPQWRAYCERVRSSPLLSGRKGTWVASIDWVLEPKNLRKIAEGNYDERTVEPEGDVRGFGAPGFA
jgi:uncharacterized protein YdaU (DUF1376 family)